MADKSFDAGFVVAFFSFLAQSHPLHREIRRVHREAMHKLLEKLQLVSEESLE